MTNPFPWEWLPLQSYHDDTGEYAGPGKVIDAEGNLVWEPVDKGFADIVLPLVNVRAVPLLKVEAAEKR